MRITWGAFYVLLYLYRCGFSVLGQVVVMKLTSIPDTAGFLATDLAQLAIKAQGQALTLDIAMQAQAGIVAHAIAAVLHLVGGGSALVINLGFQTIAFAGIVLFMRALRPRPRGVVAVLLMFPSFTVWTSIASKEALVVLLVAILAKHVLDMVEGRDRSLLYYLLILAPVCAALFLFKPHFLAAVVFIIGVMKVAQHLRRPATFALLAGSLSLAALAVFSRPIDAFVRARYLGVYGEPGNMERGPPMLSAEYDTFVRAPEGMWRSFVGPSVAEASSGLLQMVSLIESMTMIALLLLYVLPRLPRTPAYMAIASFFTLFWILFATYPLGIANAGTAVRYRADYILLVLLALVPLLSRSTYVDWREMLKLKLNRGRLVQGVALSLERRNIESGSGAL